LSKGYAIVRPGNRIEGIGMNRLRWLMEQGEFSPFNYVYDYDQLLWIRPSDEPTLATIELLAHWIESPFEKPSFNPPPFPPEMNDSVPDQIKEEVYTAAENPEVDKWQLEVSLLEQENADAMERLIEKENRIVELMEQNKILRSDVWKVDLESKIVQLENSNMASQQQIEILKKEVLFYKHKLAEKSKALRSLKIKARNLLKSKEELGEHFEQAINTGLLVQKELEHLQEDITKLKIEKPKVVEKIVVVEKKVEEPVQKKVVARKPPEVKPNFERMQETLNTKSPQELQTLMGEFYEISNNPVWMIQHEGVEKRPFRFEDVRSMIKFNRLDHQSQLKKKGELNWSPMIEYAEFSAPVEEVDVNEDGTISRHFLIKRSEYRAPFYEVAEVQVGNVTVKGFCVSLSVSGCFIELPRLNDKILSVGAEVEIVINATSLNHRIQSKAIIRRLSQKRPKGIGLSFEFLNAESKVIIETFINQLLNKQLENAA